MAKIQEVWKPVYRLENDYRISESGILERVSNARGTVPGYRFTPSVSHKGYLITRLRYGKNYKTIQMHRLVAEVFVSNPENKPQVNHKDGNKKNNHYSNLEWVTNQENVDHAWANNLMPEKGYYKGKFGKDHNRSISLRCVNIDTGVEKIIIGINEAARKLKTNSPAIWRVLSGEYRHTKRWVFSRI